MFWIPSKAAAAELQTKGFSPLQTELGVHVISDSPIDQQSGGTTFRDSERPFLRGTCLWRALGSRTFGGSVGPPFSQRTSFQGQHTRGGSGRSNAIRKPNVIFLGPHFWGRSCRPGDM